MKSFHRIFALLAVLLAAQLFAEDATPPTTAATSPATAGMPTFPLKSSRFDLLDDSKDTIDDGMPDSTSYDAAMMLDLIPAIQASSLEHLKANVDHSASFKKIFNHPNDYRGHVVQFESTVKFLYDNPEKLTDAKGNVVTLARGHLASSYQLITFLSVDPLPPGLKSGDAVMLTGVFVQRFAYVNRKTPGVELTWTPLILAKRLEPITIKEEAPANTAWIIGYIFFSLMAVGLFLAYSSRESRRTIRENVFRKIKVQRSGKDRLFPGP